jgi:hypothetical protein
MRQATLVCMIALLHPGDAIDVHGVSLWDVCEAGKRLTDASIEEIEFSYYVVKLDRIRIRRLK